MSKKNDDSVQQDTANVLKIKRKPGEVNGASIAKAIIDPAVRHAHLAAWIAGDSFGGDDKPSAMASTAAMKAIIAEAEAGNMNMASRLLSAQAMTLDALFTAMTNRACHNLGEYPQAVDRYLRLAFRAQSNCRTTIEALAKIHQPREQTVRHIHVNEGGQALVADHFHTHLEGTQYANSAKQSHATGTAGESAPMLGQDSQGAGLPIASGEGPQAMPDARRNKSRRA